MKKIVVVGVSCSGKTTLGIKLAKVLDSKPVDIDEIHWKPGWVSTSAEELLPKVKEALDCPKWIVSGNYSSLQEYIFSSADTIIWLDYKPTIIAKRAIGRSLKRAIYKESCCNGNYETLRQTFLSKNSILWWIIKTYKRRKRQYQKIIDDSTYGDKKFVRLKSPKETEFFLNTLQQDG